MARWVAFVGLTAVLTAALLALARLSQRAVDDDGPASRLRGGELAQRSEPGADPAATRSAATDPVLPRFETAAEFGRRANDPTVAGARERGVGTDGPSVDDLELSTGALLANVAITQGGFGLVLAAGAWYFEIPASAFGVATLPVGQALGVGVAFGVVLWLANELASVVADAAGAGYDEGLREMLAPDGPGGWALLLLAVLPMVAVVEEFVFRAALIGVPATGLGLPAWALAVVSSLGFGLAHGAQGRTGMVVTGGLGLALAAGFVVTGSLLVVVVAHYLVNALELVVHEGLGVDRLDAELLPSVDG